MGDDAPYGLKAGLISNLKIKFSLNFWSNAVQFEIEDLLIILGPSINKDEDEDTPAPNLGLYDENDALKNLIKTHKKVYSEREKEKEERKEKTMKEREERARKKAEEAKKPKKKKASSSSEPPINLLISLIGNLKFSIKRIHFRIEDDYFNHYRPVAFGLMIEEISFLTSDKFWVFDSPLTMQHESRKAENMSTTLKDLIVKNIKVYWNSMSEMFVPTSLWLQTRNMER